MSSRPVNFGFPSWLLAVALLFSLVAPATHAATTGNTTLPIALQGNYTISSVGINLNGSNQSAPVPSTGKKYSLTLGSKGLTAVNATTLGTIFKDLNLGTLLKATVTSTTPTSLKGTLSGKVSYGSVSVTVGSGSTLAATVASPGVLTITGTVKGTVKLFIINIPYTLGFTITMKKPAPAPAKS